MTVHDGTRRLDGVDVARGLAIVGMLTRHVGPIPTDEPVASLGWFYTRTDGRAAVLFVLVAGVGVALLAARRPRPYVRARLVYRALWLLPLGLWLATLDHPVAVILQFYAVFFLAVLPLVRARDVTLLVWAAGLAVAGPAAVLAARVLAPDLVAQLGGRAPLPVELLVTGVYPAVTYLPPMLVGVWLGRRLLAARAAADPGAGRRLAGVMALVGAAVLVLVTAISVALARVGVVAHPTGWSYAWSVDGHAEMPLALLGATGTAVLVLALCLLVAERLPRVTWPATAFGRSALTIYVAHLLVFDRFPGLLESTTVTEGVATVAAVTTVGALGAVAWLAVRPRGPLEGLEHAVFTRSVAPLVTADRADA